MALTQREIDDQNRYLLLQRARLRRGAECVAEAFVQEPRVERVALFGSLAKPPWKEVPRFRAFRRARVEVWHECSDADLAVWVRDLHDLDAEDRLLGRLRRLRIRALDALYREENVGVAHHQVEAFLLEPGTGRYLGRLCAYNACPKGKPGCAVPGCGAVPFLRQHEGFRFFDDALHGAAVLFDRAAPPPPSSTSP